MLYALEHGSPEDRSRLAELIAVPDPASADVAEIVELLERAGAREYTRAEAHRHRDAALAELAGLSVVDPAARAKLTEIINSVISA